MAAEQNLSTREYLCTRRGLKSGVVIAAFVLIFLTVPPSYGSEIDAVVYTKKDDGSRGKRVYRDSFLTDATEERSASFSNCGDPLFGYRDKVDKLLSYHKPGYVVIFYRSTIDPVTKNSRRTEVCRLDGAS